MAAALDASTNVCSSRNCIIQINNVEVGSAISIFKIKKIVSTTVNCMIIFWCEPAPKTNTIHCGNVAL